MLKHLTGPSALWLSLCLFTVGLAQPPAPQRPLPEETIAELIKQLGSEVPEVREKATERLMRRRDAAPLLRRALTSTDPEVVRRATRILEALARREAERFLKDGEADQFVEWLVWQPKGKDADASWQVASDLAAKLIALGKSSSLKEIAKHDKFFLFRDFGRYRAEARLDFTTGDRISISEHDRYIIRAENIHINAVASGVLVSSGRITSTRKSGSGGIILANDSIEIENTDQSVIICDGDVTVRSTVQHSIIVARGKVHVQEHVIRDSTIATASTFHSPAKPGDLVTSSNREKEAEPLLGVVRFFDPARAGIDVVLTKDRLDVKTVAKDKPFARAGIQAGDSVLAVDGTEVASVESFRKLLRRAVATQPEVSLKVRRDGEARSFKVPLGD